MLSEIFANFVIEINPINFSMKITFMTGLLLVCLTVMCASCSPEIDIQNMDNNIEVGNMNSNIVDGELFTAQSTVGEVINDPAFGNFGNL